jgi:endoglucanase
VNKLPLRFNLPGRIQSENFYHNNGLVSETCTDTGGGYDMGFAAPGDYMDYLVYVPQAGNYNFNFRVASERQSSQIIIRIGEGNSFTAVDTVTVTSTGGWQIWKTVSTTAFLPEGRYTIRMYVRSGEFNTNWFEAVKAPVTGIETSRNNGFSIYPNPASDVVTIEMEGSQIGEKTISFYNSVGQIVKTIKYFEPKSVEIDISDLNKGLYFVEVKAGNGLKQTTKLVVW